MSSTLFGLNGQPIKSEDKLVVLDSGTIIDLEEMLRKSILPHNNAGFLLRENPDTYFLTESVMTELQDHRDMQINGYVREIEPYTLDVCSRIHERSKLILDELECDTAIDFENIRYITYQAAQNAFQKGHKKREIDPISSNDRDIVATTFYMAQARPEIGVMGQVALASPDSHLKKTAEVLNKSNLFTYPVEFLATRTKK